MIPFLSHTSHAVRRVRRPTARPGGCMRRLTPFVIAFLSALAVCLASEISVNAIEPGTLEPGTPGPLDRWTVRPSSAGRVSGLVRDIAGQGVADASVLALGQTI